MDSYPSARIDTMLEKVAVNRFFSTIGLRSAYHQVSLHPDDYKLTAFEACGKLYEFKRLPFWCKNAVAIFQRTMDNFISANNPTNTYAYLDDIIIGGRTKEEHEGCFQEGCSLVRTTNQRGEMCLLSVHISLSSRSTALVII